MGKERHMKLLIEGVFSGGSRPQTKGGPGFFRLPCRLFFLLRFSFLFFFFSGNKGGTGGRATQAPPLDPFAGVSLTNKLELNNYDDDLFCVVYFHRRL